MNKQSGTQVNLEILRRGLNLIPRTAESSMGSSAETSCPSRIESKANRSLLNVCNKKCSNNEKE